MRFIDCFLTIKILMVGYPLEMALLYIALLIVASRLLGELFVRARQPAMIGEILAGMILGPMMLSVVEIIPEIRLFIVLGIYFLMFLVGYEEVSIEELLKAMRPSLIVSSLISFFLPFTACLLVFNLVLAMDSALSALLSSIIALTSLGVVVRIASELQMLRSKYGLRLTSMAVLNEMTGLVLASAMLEMLIHGETPGYAVMAIRVLLFFLLAGLIGYFVVPKVVRKAEMVFKVKAASFATLIAIILIFAYLSSLAGLHGVLGSLIAGFAMSRMKWDPVIVKTVDQLKGFAHGIFIPLFFAGAGLYVTRDFLEMEVFAACMIALAFVLSKIGTGLVISKLMRAEQKLMVTLMQLAKGGVEIALLSFALSLGLLPVEVYSYVIILIFLLTVVSSSILNMRRMKYIA